MSSDEVKEILILV